MARLRLMVQKSQVTYTQNQWADYCDMGQGEARLGVKMIAGHGEVVEKPGHRVRHGEAFSKN